MAIFQVYLGGPQKASKETFPHCRSRIFAGCMLIPTLILRPLTKFEGGLHSLQEHKTTHATG